MAADFDQRKHIYDNISIHSNIARWWPYAIFKYCCITM